MSAASDESQQTCPKCGAPLQRDGDLAGQCFVCLLETALDEEGIATATHEQFDHYKVATHSDGTPVVLGRGAMGITFKASDTVLGNGVALKVIDLHIAGNPEARERFLREARAAARLRNPNVASVFYYGVRKSDNQCFYAMELVEGETLEVRLRRTGPMAPTPALEVITQVAKALVAAEALGLVHRDLKPSNLMLVDGPELTVKVIDFGLAKVLVPAGSETDLTHGGFVGTPAFASPEQFTGTSVDVRSDLYSLGITLWKMLTGQTPFQGSVSEVMNQHQRAPLPLEQLKGFPQPVVLLIEVFLEKEPRRRFQKPAELLQSIQTITTAVKAGRHITLQSLRAVDGQPLSRQRQLMENLGKLPLALFLWPAVALLIAALIFAAFNHSTFVSTTKAIAKVPEKSIAVLPFESLSDNKNDSYFADGVQDEILNNLAKIAQLKVISRTSVMQYRADSKRDLRQIAVALGVANVLEGTVRRDGNSIRVNTELIDASNDNTIWADSYDRDITNVFAIQSEIAQSVASRLRTRLSPEERKSIEDKPTNSLQTYDLYLQAKELIAQVTAISLPTTEREDLSKAINLLTKGVQQDPNFALGYCLIAKAHDYLYSDLIDHSRERRALGDTSVNEALRLRPDFPEAHLAAAFHLYACYKDFANARAHIAIAAQSVPNSSDLLQLSALIDQVQGRWDSATVSLEKALNMDPRNAELLESLADHYSNLRRFKDADQLRKSLIEMHPDQPLFALNRADAAFCYNGDLTAVRAAYEATPPSMKDDPQIRNQLGYYAMCARDFKPAHEIAEKSSSEDIYFGFATVPSRCADIWLEMLQGHRPSIAEFRTTREQLFLKIRADPSNAILLSAASCIDMALGNKEEAVSEAKRAIDMLPISKDALIGPLLVKNLTVVYAWAGEPDLAFGQINILVERPNNNFLNYGDLKWDPGWDPLRNDPRFEKVLKQLAPRM
jgi:serine/threonine protein kinase